MNRTVRRVLRDRGLPNPGPESVERWIGFAADEYGRVQRMKPENKYNRYRFPLVEMRLRKRDVFAYYRAHDLPIPPRSVCDACPANKPEHYRKMRLERPEEFAVVLDIDEKIRHVPEQIGLDQARELFISDQLKPIEVIAADEYVAQEQLGFSWFCEEGVCFL